MPDEDNDLTLDEEAIDEDEDDETDEPVSDATERREKEEGPWRFRFNLLNKLLMQWKRKAWNGTGDVVSVSSGGLSASKAALGTEDAILRIGSHYSLSNLDFLTQIMLYRRVGMWTCSSVLRGFFDYSTELQKGHCNLVWARLEVDSNIWCEREKS
ncbi:hypothetical protein ACEPPN_005965 [Leptodophora sp. 'Broadleaf-Isolate-01']